MSKAIEPDSALDNRVRFGRAFLWSETSPSGRHRYYALLALFMTAFGTVLAGNNIVFPLDDAYITIHSAQVLLSGHDPNYNVPALVGATSSVHLLLVAAAMTIMSPLYASFTVGYLAVILYAVGLARIAFQLGGSYFTASVFAFLGLTTGYAPLHIINGLETGLAMAATTWTLSVALSPNLARVLPPLCGVLPFIRPELGIRSGVLMLRRFWWRLREGDIASIVVDCVSLLAAAAPWLLLGGSIPDRSWRIRQTQNAIFSRNRTLRGARSWASSWQQSSMVACCR